VIWVQFKPVYFKIGLVLGVLILIGYVSLIFIGKNGLGDLDAMKQELQKINIKNEEIRQENVEIYRKIERLKTDPVYMENIAREELKMIGEKEMVFKFDDAKQPKTDMAPPASDAPPLTPDTVSPEPAPITPLEPLPPPESTGEPPKD
jgi:cell division protein FtsB